MDSKDEKAARLAAALRANLRRRKAQTRGVDAAVSAGGEEAAEADRGPGGAVRDR